VEQKRRPRYESTQLCPPDFLTKVPKTYVGDKTASSDFAEQSGYLPAEN
jgi:hypothetical protein